MTKYSTPQRMRPLGGEGLTEGLVWKLGHWDLFGAWGLVIGILLMTRKGNKHKIPPNDQTPGII